ncbi:V-set and transmembrane domain-containing protein 4a [Gadus macrocephalus]|uniref:V-set and transmembrane domain-containing protein 4a n=1 Tax=Gadus macrocephalus TaxID=80720 RepID=UPI0028CB1425|nr:V-set and transmembrane domain-containing protein 4a [Gadus macrocephalus]
MYFSLVALVLTKALLTEVCDALNVTVVPGPVAMVTERDNLTLSCLVSQRKRASGVLVLRWFFSPAGAVPPPSSSSPSPPPPPPPSPQPSPSSSPSSEVLIVRMGIKKMKQYGNYSRRFPQPKFLLQEEPAGGEVFRLLILNVTAGDRGVYSCRVQEIRRHRNIWRASSNGTGSTTLAGTGDVAPRCCPVSVSGRPPRGRAQRGEDGR